MIAFAPTPKPNNDSNIKLTPPSVDTRSELEQVFDAVRFALNSNGFDLSQLGTDYVLRRDGKELIIAPSMGDMLILMSLTSAWSLYEKGT